MNETTDQPDAADRYQWAGLVRPARRLPARTFTVAGITIALIAGILIGRALGPVGVEPALSPSPTSAAVDSPAPSATDTPATTIPGPTPPPIITISGELPPPGATLPSGTPRIPRLDTFAVVETAVALGFTCDSGRVHDGPFYWLLCEGHSAATNARYTVSADYGTLDTVSAVHVAISRRIDDSRSLGDPNPEQTAERILVPFIRLLPVLPGAAAEQWLDDSRCTGVPNCIRSELGISVMVVTGDEPGLYIWPTSAALTPFPSAPVSGDLPGLDATVPPGVDVIKGLTLDDVLATAGSLGLSCEARRGSFPGGGIEHYEIDCRTRDQTANADFSASAYLYTEHAIFQVTASVTSITDLPILDPTAALRLVLPFVELVGGDAAREWVQRAMDDPSCRHGCSRNIAGVSFNTQWGRVYIEPAT